MEWAIWAHDLSFLPPIYHESKDALDQLIYWIQSDVWLTGTGGVTSKVPVLDKFLLVTGLLYRNMKTVHFLAEDSDGNPSTSLPLFITKSVFEFDTLTVAFDAVLERMAARLEKSQKNGHTPPDVSGTRPSGQLPTPPVQSPLAPPVQSSLVSPLTHSQSKQDKSASKQSPKRAREVEQAGDIEEQPVNSTKVYLFLSQLTTCFLKFIFQHARLPLPQLSGCATRAKPSTGEIEQPEKATKPSRVCFLPFFQMFFLMFLFLECSKSPSASMSIHESQSSMGRGPDPVCYDWNAFWKRQEEVEARMVGFVRLGYKMFPSRCLVVLVMT